MARMARVVIPGYPHHIVQRGNRRQKTFFSADDYRAYIDLVARTKDEAGISIWAYCLMPNHVHLVAVPDAPDSLAELFRYAHRSYTRRINSREGWRGHLWQERFRSCAMDEPHLMAAVRYVELNPVRAQLCSAPANWPWSSVHAHLRGADDALISTGPMLERVSNWRHYLATQDSEEQLKTLRQHVQSGRPAGDNLFIERLERMTGLTLRKDKPGRRTIK
jgi:putative transposase